MSSNRRLTGCSVSGRSVCAAKGLRGPSPAQSSGLLVLTNFDRFGLLRPGLHRFGQRITLSRFVRQAPDVGSEDVNLGFAEELLPRGHDVVAPLRDRLDDRRLRT